MKARRAARRVALDVLYEASIRDLLPTEAWKLREGAGWSMSSGLDDGEDVSPDTPAPGPDVLDYARSVVDGVQAHQADIDALVSRYADRWAIDRMPVVDLSIVRMALYELLFRDDIPVAVGINEAVELAKSFSTDDSGRFVNGLLGRIAEDERASSE
ncbi:MAG TPA: transcription antitermination factor NusB [Actinomycetota bacterium]